MGLFFPDNATASATPPAMPAVGTEGYFTNGTPPSIPPTNVDAWWFHTIGSELDAILTAAGIAPAKGTLNQLLLALQVLFPQMANLGGSLGTNGHIAIPCSAVPSGVVLIQWVGGSITSTGAGNTSIQLNLPVVFPNAHLRCIPFYTGNAPGAVGSLAGNPFSNTQAQITMYTSAVTSNEAVACFCIGY